LSGSDLTGANLSESSLGKTDLSGARIFYVNLDRADLSGANFSGVELSAASFGGNDLSKVKGLEMVTYSDPSHLGIDTVINSGGNIPEAFLRGCGASEGFITFARSLVGDFHTCFISYSSKDQEFAERLHADLQDKGVRCWFAPEDLKIGDRFRDRIDESIRLHDKLLIILSENSVSSQWVGDEVEAAFERERRENRTVLFPIQIDGAVTESIIGWAAAIRRRRHIGDFTNWKSHDSYQKAFDRLLCDLKAEA
jgi:hypothetical protein